ncbi:hypothetical protein KQX54_020574 [Cotesia glomerata]|uniref:Odorant receptor n=1 Tax=Cotesia glomerata TaxID=32391 RepID=A0AAV7HM37_COTGL|nr:hypothetical protein KQX54_020574 [Cotesia glomerata]
MSRQITVVGDNLPVYFILGLHLSWKVEVESGWASFAIPEAGPGFARAEVKVLVCLWSCLLCLGCRSQVTSRNANGNRSRSRSTSRSRGIKNQRMASQPRRESCTYSFNENASVQRESNVTNERSSPRALYQLSRAIIVFQTSCRGRAQATLDLDNIPRAIAILLLPGTPAQQELKSPFNELCFAIYSCTILHYGSCRGTEQQQEIERERGDDNSSKLKHLAKAVLHRLYSRTECWVEYRVCSILTTDITSYYDTAIICTIPITVMYDVLCFIYDEFVFCYYYEALMFNVRLYCYSTHGLRKLRYGFMLLKQAVLDLW